MKSQKPRRTILLSLKPRFAYAILDGDKTVELRRQRVAAQVGAAVLLYASAPVMAIVGTARVEAVDVNNREEIWRLYKNRMFLSRREFEHYLHDIEEASAIVLDNAQIFSEPITLRQLRDGQKFHPPQSYRYVEAATDNTLGRLVATIIRNGYQGINSRSGALKG